MIDPKEARRQATEMDRGPFGDARPDKVEDDSRANPSLPQEEVEGRDNVSTIKPEDYPLQDRELSRPE
jgi:hypothetical protein